ncbi:hypothetical protein E2C01_056366 [Portunus trituberculatus]|uniref:Uncharacterized protein n=1 Tax=Portunus trituberculatus TaxID=210409 RepID=A0A5B7H0C5_PORTR|nr:hypothetical protein [Portunus trituberculatus]
MVDEWRGLHGATGARALPRPYPADTRGVPVITTGRRGSLVPQHPPGSGSLGCGRRHLAASHDDRRSTFSQHTRSWRHAPQHATAARSTSLAHQHCGAKQDAQQGWGWRGGEG